MVGAEDSIEENFKKLEDEVKKMGLNRYKKL